MTLQKWSEDEANYEDVNELVVWAHDLLQDEEFLRNHFWKFIDEAKETSKTFGFETALKLLKDGKKVRRRSWKILSEYIFLTENKRGKVLGKSWGDGIFTDIPRGFWDENDWEVVDD